MMEESKGKEQNKEGGMETKVVVDGELKTTGKLMVKAQLSNQIQHSLIFIPDKYVHSRESHLIIVTGNPRWYNST